MCSFYRELGARSTSRGETYSGPQGAFGLGTRDFKPHYRRETVATVRVEAGQGSISVVEDEEHRQRKDNWE